MTDKVKLGNVIQKFSNSPLHLELLLFPEKLKNSTLTSTQKKRHQEVYSQLFYSGKGKSYFDRISGTTKYYQNKNGFYVLELPDTTSPDCEKDNSCKSKDDLGFKLGKAESNPTSAESGVVSAKSGGLFSRLMSYFIELGKNVRILNLRIFSSEDLNFLGKKLRAREYENAIKEELRKKNIQPIRGSTGSEYFKKLKPIQDAINRVDKYPDSFIRDIAPDEKEGQQIMPNVETRSQSKNKKVQAKTRVIIMSKEYKVGRQKLGTARGTVIKKTRSNPNDKYWDILFDDQVKKGVKRATIEMTFSPDLYNQKKEGGWVYESDNNVLNDFKKTPKVL